jgi:hypothetical protein
MRQHPDFIERKEPRIRELVHELEAVMPGESYQIVDHWDADTCAIGVASRSDPRRLVYVSTYDQSDGTYAFECEVPMDADADDYQVVDEGAGLRLDTLLLKIREHLLQRAQ